MTLVEENNSLKKELDNLRPLVEKFTCDFEKFYIWFCNFEQFFKPYVFVFG